MKFFISLVSVITQINLCQSYDEIKPLIIMVREQDLELENGIWLTTLVDTEKSEQKKICESVLEAQIFIRIPSDKDDYHLLLKRDELLPRIELEMIPTSLRDFYFWNQERIPLLLCSFGYILFYLAIYSNHEGYIIFSESRTPVGVVTKSYRYQRSDESIANDIFRTLIELPREIYVLKHPELPLYSLNQFNQAKLCATFISFVLLNIRNMPPENKRNITFTTRFLLARNEQFVFADKYLKCKLWNERSGDTDIILYILQIEKRRVIIKNNEYFDMFDILEFEAESSSSR